MPEGRSVKTEAVDAVVGGESLGHDVAEQLTRLGPFGLGNPGVRLLVPGARLSDVRPMGEGDRHARFSLSSGSRRALGVAFGVNGELDRAVKGGPLDVSVKLELNEWNGAVEPRVVLGNLYPQPSAGPATEPRPSTQPHPATDPAAPGRGAEEAAGFCSREAAGIGSLEFWRRFDGESELDLSMWPPALGDLGSMRREQVDRRGGSGVASIAALASSGGSVLVLCADAPRRRELVERAARPARFGGGELAIVSARGPDAAAAALGAARRQAERGAVVLADWGALARAPELSARFEHLVVVDPAPFAHLDRLAAAGEGYLHRLDGPAEVEFALRVHAEEWPSRALLAGLYRSLRERLDGRVEIDAALACAVLSGEHRTHPRSPEVAARCTRVLAELDLVRWAASRRPCALGVVSSSRTDLERSKAFVAYRDRYEEGRRYLSEQRQT
jgi:single-stranded-DNA-specific exonuclease